MADRTYTPDVPYLYHFKLDRILGEGGTGRVYRGVDTREGRVVAVKRFHETFFRNALHQRDLKKSIKRFKKFDHPNVVKIFDFLNKDDNFGDCMVMEYIDGPDLKWYIVNRPWNLRERLTIVAQICNGLQYLHDKKVIHHDFKPANVLFTRKGQVKLADFSLYGSSLLLELFDRGAGEQVTPMYVAPEFLRKEIPTTAVDQYTLGVTMYLMFASPPEGPVRQPFPVDSLPALYRCHLQIMPDHPSISNPACPQELGDIILKLMNKKPKDRFKDCDELRIALSSIGRSRI